MLMRIVSLSLPVGRNVPYVKQPRQSLTAEQCRQGLYMRYMPLISWKSAFLTFYRGYEQIVDIIGAETADCEFAIAFIHVIEEIFVGAAA
jgi:hypothetical protein